MSDSSDSRFVIRIPGGVRIISNGRHGAQLTVEIDENRILKQVGCRTHLFQQDSPCWSSGLFLSCRASQLETAKLVNISHSMVKLVRQCIGIWILNGIVPVCLNPILFNPGVELTGHIVFVRLLPIRHFSGIKISPVDILVRVLRIIHEGHIVHVSAVAALGNPMRPECEAGISGLQVANSQLHERLDVRHVNPPARDVLYCQKIDIIGLGARKSLVTRRPQYSTHVGEESMTAIAFLSVYQGAHNAKVPDIQTCKRFDDQSPAELPSGRRHRGRAVAGSYMIRTYPFLN